MRFIILLVILVVVGCSGIDDLSVKPSKTTFTYGTSSTTNDTVKDAKNDSTTTADSAKESWTIKQEFVWGRNK